MRLTSNLLFHLSRKRIIQSRPGDVAGNPATFTPVAYQQWRDSDLQGQFLANFDPGDLRDQDVLDFGCGEGGLTFLAATFGAKSLTGIDLNQSLIQSAQNRLREIDCSVPIRFLEASGTKEIDVQDESMDLILCFDVLEHILDYREIIAEWHRILRPGGRVFIWWQPWFHPYGHHIEALVPLPWVHALFPEKTLVEVCARIYDMPEFKPRIWDLDERGAKRQNKWLSMKSLPDVNRLTISQFERTCGRNNLQIEERKTRGFRQSRPGPLTQLMSQVPWVQEFFCSHVVYKLRKA